MNDENSIKVGLSEGSNLSCEFSGKDRVNTLRRLSSASTGSKDGGSLAGSRRAVQALAALEAQKNTKNRISEAAQSQRVATTCQRFAAKLQGRSFLVRVLLSRDQGVCLSFFDVEAGRTTRVKRIRSGWLAHLESEAKEALLTSGLWFRENVSVLYEGACAVHGSGLGLDERATPQKPRRRPPPAPKNSTPLQDPFSAARNLAESESDDDEILLLMEDAERVAEAGWPGETALLVKRVETLTSTIGDLESALDTAHSSQADLEARLKNASEKSDELLLRAQVAEDEIKVQAGALAVLTCRLEQAQAAHAEQQRAQALELQAAQAQVTSLEAELERAKQEAPANGAFEDRLNTMKLKLFDAADEKTALESKLRECESALTLTMHECETLVKEVREQGEKELEAISFRCAALKKQQEEAFANQEQAEMAMKDAQNQCMDAEQRLRAMELQAGLERKQFEQDLAEQKQARAALEEELQVMTVSKNENKEYGAKVKAKLVEYAQQLAVANEQLAARSEQVTELERRLAVSMDETREAKSEMNEMSSECTVLGHELDVAKRACRELEELAAQAQHQEQQANEQRRLVEVELAERITEFDALIKQRRQQYDELKIQIFDERAKAERDKKAFQASQTEVEELEGYVQSLLAEADKCPTCRQRNAKE